MRRHTPALAILLGITILLSACGSEEAPAELPQPRHQVSAYTASPSPTSTPQPTQTSTANLLSTLTPTLPPTATPDPYLEMYISTLVEGTYGGGVLQDAGNLPSNGTFRRKLFRYRSEGLNLYGFINIPAGEGPCAVVVMLHGYVAPEEYATLDYSTRYADALAQAGFIVVHPNLRGYAPSPRADNLFGSGDTRDVLNLISLIRNQAGSAGLLEKADGQRIGLWGHSMGGGIVLRALIADPEIKAALLYASVHADEAENLRHFDDDGRGNEKIRIPDSALELISPIDHLGEIQAVLSVHHGEADGVVPVKWSEDLCAQLEELGVEAECTFYANQPHTFQNSGDTRFIANMIAFFTAQL